LFSPEGGDADEAEAPKVMPNYVKLNVGQLGQFSSYNMRFPVESEGENKSRVIKSSRHIMEEMGGVMEIVANLGSGFDKESGRMGIDPKTFEERRSFYGPNKLPDPPVASLYEIIMENFADFINQVLLGACIVSCVMGYAKDGPKGLVEGFSIAIALVLIIAVSSVNNYSAEMQIAEQLKILNDDTCEVFRGSGTAITIPVGDVVVGDIFRFSTGLKVPADGIMLEGENVQCDESALSGENLPEDKSVLTEESM
jgi:Ca2+-transporting ATPase